MINTFYRLKHYYSLLAKYFKSSASSSSGEKAKGWWATIQAFYGNLVKVFFAVIFLLLVFHAIYELFRYDFVVKPFDMPFDLSRQGYTGTVVAYRLQEQMIQVRKEIQRASTQGFGRDLATIQLSELEKRQQIDVPAIGLSLNTVISQLRRLLGIKQPRISGDVVVKGEKIYLTLRVTDYPIFKTDGDDIHDPEELIERAAKYVLKMSEPLLFGQNYCLNKKNDELADLIKKVQQRQLSQKEKALALIFEGCLLKNHEKYELALEKLKLAQQLNPKNPLIFLMMGDTLVEMEAYEKAIAEYQKALNFDSKNGEIYTKWAKALLKQGDIEAGFAKYQEAAKKDSQNPWVYTDWGEKLVEHKKFEQAIEKFQHALEIDPNYALAYAIWGNMLRQTGDLEAARQKYEKAVALKSKIAWVYGNWGWTLAQLGEYEKAIVQYQEAIELKKLGWIYKLWADALVSLKRYEAALAQYQKAIELEPNNQLYYYAWGDTWLQLGQYERAIERYQKAIALNKRTAVWSHIKTIYARVQLKQYTQALNDCETILPTDFNEKAQAATQALCGLAFVGMSQPQMAIKRCEMALELYEEEDWAYWCLAEVFLTLNYPDEAISKYEKAIELKPENAFYHYQLAELLTKWNQYKKAIFHYQKAITLNPGGQIGQQAQQRFEVIKNYR
jgi:tetratricopeptide (TPR) repeat protein